MIDEVSLHILNILQEKARIPNVEVARQVGMAPSAVLERIRKLEKQGVIDGYEVRLNPAQFNRRLIAFVFVRTLSQPGIGPAEIPDRLAEMPEVQEVHHVAGDDCLLLKLRVSDPEELGRLLREAITPIPGVASTRTLTVLSTYKETARFPISGILPGE
jgi:Lrp/AsnC family leucine-responsive transcriptional regulator